MTESLQFLHRLAFARGSEALDFLRTLRELAGMPLRAEVSAGGPILIYGARIVTPDAPAELYVSVGALALAHGLGLEALGRRHAPDPSRDELPADMALLFRAEWGTEQGLSP